MLTEFIECCVVCWIFLGIPCLAVVFGLSFLRIFRRLRGRPVVWLVLPLLGLFFGLATGYFNVWADHQYYAAGGQNHWYDCFGLFGAPGNGMANSYGGDWQSDEAWVYRSDIAFWNALFWVSVAIVGAWLLRFVARRRSPEITIQPTSGAQCKLRLHRS